MNDFVLGHKKVWEIGPMGFGISIGNNRAEVHYQKME